MKATEFFEYLGAPLRNSRWSWGGMNSDGAVFLRTWSEQNERIDGVTCYLILDHERYQEGPKSPGYNERKRHVQQIVEGAKCYLVMCEAEDINASPRRIKAFDEENLLVGGVVHDEGEEVWIEVVGKASVEAIRQTPERVFGEISGFPIGSTFATRKEMSEARVHPPTQAGISGSASEGADSIVLSGGYEDDEDLGDTIIYTGQGGQDPNTRKQVKDQELTRGNKALAISYQKGLPVRVVRGSTHKSEWSPETGYLYCGLYQITDCWHERGKSGFLVWRFRLERSDDAAVPVGQKVELDSAGGAEKPGRKKTTTLRVVRDTALSRSLKQYYDFTCQVCGIRLEGPGGPYAEAAHIRPLGRPHNGPDTTDNLICLCPNHHFLFDVGAFSVADDHSLIGMDGALSVLKNHDINSKHLEYHRDHFGLT
jgi:putative restriction endonuclease